MFCCLVCVWWLGFWWLWGSFSLNVVWVVRWRWWDLLWWGLFLFVVVLRVCGLLWFWFCVWLRWVFVLFCSWWGEVMLFCLLWVVLLRDWVCVWFVLGWKRLILVWVCVGVGNLVSGWRWWVVNRWFWLLWFWCFLWCRGCLVECLCCESVRVVLGYSEMVRLVVRVDGVCFWVGLVWFCLLVFWVVFGWWCYWWGGWLRFGVVFWLCGLFGGYRILF